MQALVVSESGGTYLTVQDGCWILGGTHGAKPADQTLVGLLPLLEREPGEGLAAVAGLHGPPFPWQALLVVALSGDSPYWQEQAVSWLDALNLRPEGPIADAARDVLQRRRAGQRHRHQLHRWLQGRPTRKL